MYRRNGPDQSLGFRLVNASTGEALTGAAVSVYRSIDGGPQAAAAGVVVEIGLGQYCFLPTAADLNGKQVSFLFLATGAVPEEKTVVTTAADPTDPQRFGLSALPGSGSLAVKPAVTLAASDVGGNLPTDIQSVRGQDASATQPVAFPAAIASQAIAPSWYSAPAAVSAIAQAVWDFAQSALGMGATMGQGLVSEWSYSDPWTARASTVLSPAPTVNGFRIDRTALAGQVVVPGLCAVGFDPLKGIAARIASYDPATGDVVLVDPLPVAPPSEVSVLVDFAANPKVLIDLAQPLPDSAAPTVGGALAGAWAWSRGKQVLDLVGRKLKLWGPGNASATASNQFALDDPANPTTRDPL